MKNREFSHTSLSDIVSKTYDMLQEVYDELYCIGFGMESEQ